MNYECRPCTSECKPVWVKGKGSFKGWKLKICKHHQIIHEMKKESK
jgi:hypothetical protein